MESLNNRNARGSAFHASGHCTPFLEPLEQRLLLSGVTFIPHYDISEGVPNGYTQFPSEYMGAIPSLITEISPNASGTYELSVQSPYPYVIENCRLSMVSGPNQGYASGQQVQISYVEGLDNWGLFDVREESISSFHEGFDYLAGEAIDSIESALWKLAPAAVGLGLVAVAPASLVVVAAPVGAWLVGNTQEIGEILDASISAYNDYAYEESLAEYLSAAEFHLTTINIMDIFENREIVEHVIELTPSAQERFQLIVDVDMRLSSLYHDYGTMDYPPTVNILRVLEVCASQEPEVNSFFYTGIPDPVVQGGQLLLSASASDPDGSVDRVEFYRDSNGNGVLETGVDEYVGSDSSPQGGQWDWYGEARWSPGTHAFFARARDNDGLWSEPVSITVSIEEGQAELPASPSNLDATAQSAGRIKLVWQDNSVNEDGFRIYRSLSSSSGFSLIGSVGSGVETYTDEWLDADTRYYYRVYAYNSSGESDSYASDSAHTDGTVVTTFDASDGEYTDRVVLEWPYRDDAWEYKVYRDGEPITDFLGPNATSYTDYDVQQEVQYSYMLVVWYWTSPTTGSSFTVTDSGYAADPNIVFEIADATLGSGAADVSAWGDYDNDGDLDILLAGTVESNIYRNDGGVFTNIGLDMPVIEMGSATWVDYDADEDLDVFLVGLEPAGQGFWGSVSTFYRNDNGSFVRTSSGLPTYYDNSVAWGDYDNDGDLDVLMMGVMNNARQSNLYRNDHGIFVDAGVGLPGLKLGSAEWGDYDNDGDLDILLAGLGLDSGAIARVYQNDGGVFTDIAAPLPGVYCSSTKWGDYDNDGDLDILLTGRVSGGSISRVYRNTQGVFADIGAGLATSSSSSWVDYDNDGDLDIQLGAKIYRNDGSSFTEIDVGVSAYEEVSWGDYDNDGDLDALTGGTVYRNGGGVLNSSPSAPVGLSQSVEGDEVTFEWQPSSDSCTPSVGLTYNVRLGTSPGSSDVFTCTSNTATGSLLIPAMGNVQNNLSWMLKGLEPGVYFWSVQAVDSVLAGSSWAAEQTFVIERDLPVLTTNSDHLLFVENDEPSRLVPEFAVEDARNRILTEVRIWVSENYAGGEDILGGGDRTWSSTSGSSGSITSYFDENAGVLTLSRSYGQADALAFQEAIQRVTYYNSSESPSSESRTISFMVYDGEYWSDVVSMTLLVLPINDRPIVQSQAVSTNENQAKGMTLQGSDTETPADQLVYSITTQPQHGTVTMNGNQATYTPAANYNGLDSFTYAVTDNGDPAGSHAHSGDLTSSAATVSVTVTSINDKPSAQAQSVTTEEDIPRVITLLGSDPETEDAQLVYSITTQPQHGTVSISGNQATYTPMAHYNGPDSFAFKVTDTGDPADGDQGWGYGNPKDSSSATVDITVGPVNDRPTGSDDDYVASLDQPIDISLSGNDVETNYADLIFKITGGPANGTLTPASQGLYSYQPNAGSVEDSFTYTVTDTGDPDGASVNALTSAEYTISLTNGYQVNLDAKGRWEGYDADGDLVTISLRGGGTGTLLFPKIGNSDLIRLTLQDTTGRSSLTITTKGRDSGTTIGELVLDNGLLRSLTAKTTDIVGNGVSATGNGYIGSVYVRDIRNGADILLPGTGAAKGVTIKAGVLYPDTDIVLGSYLKNLTALQWVGSSLTTPWASSISIKGDRRNGIAGDFGAGLTFTGADPKRGVALGKLSVAGTITDSVITADFGSVGTIMAAQWDSGSLDALWAKNIMTKGNRRDPSITGDFGAALNLTGQDARGMSLNKLQVTGKILDSQITLSGGAGTITAAQWDSGSLDALWAKTVMTRGNRRDPNTTGDFGTVLNLTGQNKRGMSLNKLQVAGTARNSTVRTAGSMGNLILGAVDSSDFLAGISDDVTRYAADHDDFENPLASIRSVKIKGIKGAAGRFFEDTNISASALGTVSILNADFVNGECGLYACDADSDREIHRVIYRDTESGEKWSWPIRGLQGSAGPDGFIRIL